MASDLLQKNHESYHIFYKEPSFHNHLVHNVLTRLALGASPSEIQKSYDYDEVRQRTTSERDDGVIAKLHNEAFFLGLITKPDHYTNFLVFFTQLIEQRGYQDVVNEYVFSGSRIADKMLALMNDGLYHSLIHLGLGIEFAQPSIIAEALAQAAIHPSLDTDWFFETTERIAAGESGQTLANIPGGKTLVEIASSIRSSEAIRKAGLTPGIATMKQKNLLFKQTAGAEITALAARWRVRSASELDRKTAESISFSAYMAGAAQRPGKQRMVDFFTMHSVTSSLFLTVLNRAPWLAAAAKMRLVEWKTRLDLAWYATIGAPALDKDVVARYRGTPSGNMGWDALFRTINAFHDDDGHVAKFARALKNGEEAARPFEEEDGDDPTAAFPVRREDWINIARMAHDSTINYGYGAKWIMQAGLDAAWANIPGLEEAAA